MQVLLLGGGMIAQDQLLPSLYQLQRLGQRGVDRGVFAGDGHSGGAGGASEDCAGVSGCAPFKPTVTPYPELIAAMPPRQLVVVGLPDQLHYNAVMCALKHDQNVLCVKPLVLTVKQAEEIEEEARGRGLLVATEYHKRFDDRSHMARQRYRTGQFGEFKLGTASLFEKWYYRHSNFQNWFTTDATDAFTYIGCHYVDLVHFITG
jgi:D-galacturonate reductase